MGKRAVFDVPTPYTPEQINDVLTQFMSANGFRLVNYQGGQVMKKGYGFLVAPMYMHTMIGQGTVHIEAWIRAFGEKGLDGFIGVIPKQMLQSAINSLIAAINPPMPPQQPPVMQQQPPQNAQ